MGWRADQLRTFHPSAGLDPSVGLCFKRQANQNRTEQNKGGARRSVEEAQEELYRRSAGEAQDEPEGARRRQESGEVT
jgi:hypothetical protein